jgi:hypothetical protein
MRYLAENMVGIGRNKFHVLWNKRNISRTQMVERMIAVYYSATYRSAIVLTCQGPLERIILS